MPTGRSDGRDELDRYGNQVHIVAVGLVPTGRSNGREELDRRIKERSTGMIEGGLLQELRGLLDRRYAPSLPPLQAIGYRHLLPVAEGRDTLAHALEEMVRDTRRFARRQRTWFRSVKDAHWLDPRDQDALLGEVARFLDEPGETE